MRALLQRVSSAAVTVGGETVGSIGPGLLVLLGVGEQDRDDAIERLWSKIWQLRIFEDEAGKMNRSLADAGGALLVVSQFTLYADCRRGRRPSFAHAAPGERGRELYERFCERAARDCAQVERGVFGADMQVSLVNDGPVTIWLDSDELARPRRAADASS